VLRKLKPNENKISHRWRERALLGVKRINSWENLITQRVAV
jgi:hypothetical protein